MQSLDNSNLKGIGVERRRCLNCQNMQEVMAINGSTTLFFRCDKCQTETFIEKMPYDFTKERSFIDTT